MIFELNKHKIINNIVEFAKQFEKFGHECRSMPVIEYARKLSAAALSFNTLQIENVFDEFNGLIDNLKRSEGNK